MKETYIYKNKARAEKTKAKRLYIRIKSMIKNNNNCLFLTLTFNDLTLEKTNEQTRKRYIKTFLNEQAKEYILNRDFGTLNNREHYHALIIPKYKNMICYNAYKYGQINTLHINKLNPNKTIEQLIKDLQNHTTKETTKKNKIIYSRKQTKNKEMKQEYIIKIDNNLNDFEIKKILMSNESKEIKLKLIYNLKARNEYKHLNINNKNNLFNKRLTPKIKHLKLNEKIIINIIKNGFDNYLQAEQSQTKIKFNIKPNNKFNILN